MTLGLVSSPAVVWSGTPRQHSCWRTSLKKALVPPSCWKSINLGLGVEKYIRRCRVEVTKNQSVNAVRVMADL